MAQRDTARRTLRFGPREDESLFRRVVYYAGVLFAAIAVAGITLLGVLIAYFAIAGGGSQPEGFRPEDRVLPPEQVWDEANVLDLTEREDPTIRAWAVEGDSRVRKVVLELGPGADGIEVTVANRGPVAQGGQGIAVRTTEWARLLNNTEYITVSRPSDCADGCALVFWITAGHGFLERHLDAEIIIFAGQGAEGRLDTIDRLPPEAHS